MTFIVSDAGKCTYLTQVLIFLLIKDRNASGGGSKGIVPIPENSIFTVSDWQSIFRST